MRDHKKDPDIASLIRATLAVTVITDGKPAGRSPAGDQARGDGEGLKSLRLELFAHLRGFFRAASGAEPVRVLDEFIEP
jgi:hypothetical protein